MKIRQFDWEDIPSILDVQAKNAQAAQWPQSEYERLGNDPGGMILVAGLETTSPEKLLGFAAFRRVIDEAELQNIAVDPEHQQQGVGRALLEEARKRLLAAGAKRIFLEVRRSNGPALVLYYAAGFALHGLRKDYYRDPPEDAYVLALELFPPASVPALP